MREESEEIYTFTSLTSCGGWCHSRVCARTTTVKPSRTRITIRLKNEYDYGSRRMPSKVVILRSTAVVRNFKNELRAKTIREMLLTALIQTVFGRETISNEFKKDWKRLVLRLSIKRASNDALSLRGREIHHRENDRFSTDSKDQVTESSRRKCLY